MKNPLSITKNPLGKTDRVKFYAFIAFALCLMVISVAFFALSIGRPYIGVTLGLNSEGWVVKSVDAGGVAKQAGIRAGDIPVEINDQPAGAFLDNFEKSKLVYSILIYDLGVTDSKDVQKVARLENGSVKSEDIAQQISWLFVSLIFWIVGFWVFFKKPKTPPHCSASPACYSA